MCLAPRCPGVQGGCPVVPAGRNPRTLPWAQCPCAYPRSQCGGPSATGATHKAPGLIKAWAGRPVSPAISHLPLPRPGPGADLQQQTRLHGLLARDEVGLHEQDVLTQLLRMEGGGWALPRGSRLALHSGPGPSHPQDGLRPRCPRQVHIQSKTSRPGRTLRLMDPQRPQPTGRSGQEAERQLPCAAHGQAADSASASSP